MERLAVALGRKLNLSERELNELKLLAALHDIGKIGVQDRIIMKSGTLTDEEYEMIKKHCEIGYHIAKSSTELGSIAEAILHHHERWDGKGYPQGIKGKEIPLLSRIISVVDTYDVITHERPYRQTMSHEEALEEIKKCAGAQFDPEFVQAFVQMMA